MECGALVDEVLVLNCPVHRERQAQLTLPLDLFENLDCPQDVMWLLPLEVETTDLKEAIRSKTFESQESTNSYLRDLRVAPPRHEHL